MSNDVQSQSRSTKTGNCSFCGRVLGHEYFFTCHVCGAKYCYIHMYRHGRAHRLPTEEATPILRK